MLRRKIEPIINRYFAGDSDKILVLTGARQIGKSYIIRHCASRYFKNIIEINLIEDKEGTKVFDNIHSPEEFYLALSVYSAQPLGDSSDTLIFLDEIQEYPHLMTMLKFLREEGKYRYAVSGSLLGITLRKSNSVPLGSIDIVRMFPLDFEEFLWANDIQSTTVEQLSNCLDRRESLPEGVHNHILDLYKRYLLVGGLPEAVNSFIATHDLTQVRLIQNSIIELYNADAAKYDKEHSLKIGRIYSLIPSNMENKKKRVVFKEIEDKKGKRSSDYEEEIEYLISSGTTLEVKAISNPRFPLTETESKNLIKLYLNDPGLLTAILYRNNPMPVLNTEASINLGSVYECAVACQLAANGNALFYYDNRQRGEVDFLYNDYSSLTTVPLEVKSGKDYKRHVALSRFMATRDYNISKAYVVSNSREVECSDLGITYIPVYFTIFLGRQPDTSTPIYI